MKTNTKRIVKKFLNNEIESLEETVKVLSDRSGKKIISIRLGELNYIAKIFDLTYIPVKGKGPMISPIDLYKQEEKMLVLSQKFNNQYLMSYTDNDCGIIIMNKVSGEPAHLYIKNNPSESSRVVDQMIKSVKELHINGILHGDLQPAHFLVTKTTVELIDFGISGSIPGGYERYPGSLVHYASPEIAAQMMSKSEGLNYSVSSEIYSLGAVILYCLTEKLPTKYEFKTVPFLEKQKRIAENGPDQYLEIRNKELSSEMRSLLDSFLVKDMNKRKGL